MLRQQRIDLESKSTNLTRSFNKRDWDSLVSFLYILQLKSRGYNNTDRIRRYKKSIKKIKDRSSLKFFVSKT